MILEFNDIDLMSYLKIEDYKYNLISDNKMLVINFYDTDFSEDKYMRLADILYNNNKPSKLIFLDNQYFYVAKTIQTDLENITKTIKKGNLEFKLLSNKIRNRTTTQALSRDSFIDYKGHVDVFPNFEIKFNSNSSYLTINNMSKNKYIRLGSVKHLEELSNNVETVVLDTFKDGFKGFKYNNIKIDLENALSQGLFTDFIGLRVRDYYHKKINQWYGPSYSKEVDNLSNFKASMELKLDELTMFTQEYNKIQFLIEDNTKELLASMEITTDNNMQITNIILRAKNNEIILDSTSNVDVLSKFNGFDGLFEIEKLGETITFRLKNNKNNFSFDYTISSPIYLSKSISKLGVWSAKFSDKSVVNSVIKGFRLISYSNSSVFTNNLFKKGDTIKIDTKLSKIYLNDIERLDLLDLSSEFFKINKDNIALVSEDVGINGYISYNDEFIY